MGPLELIKQLAIRDFRNRYSGSILGLFWAIFQPLAMMSILWFVFAYGLKAGPQKEVNFVCWFFTANIAWNFFQEAVSSTTQVYLEYAYLVRKVNFRLVLLPIVKIISALALHAIFICIVMVILLFNHIAPRWEWLQIIYYAGSLVVLLLGLGWLLASLNVFMRDVAQIVSIFLQFGFWLTPIVWNQSALPERWHSIINLNPLFYITEGYRNSLLYGRPFWENWLAGIYYWTVTFLIFCLGLFVYRRLRRHFADLL